MIISKIIEKIMSIIKKDFIKSASIYIISTFINLSTPFFLLPVLTRYLTTKEYGIVSMINVSVSFLVPFVSLGANSAIQRQLVDNNDTNKEYVFNCLMISLLSEVILIIFCFFNKNFLSNVTGIPSVFFYQIFLIIISTVIIDISLVILQMKRKEKKYAIFQNLMTVTNFLFSIVMIVNFDMGLKGRVYGIVCSKVFFSLIGIYIIFKEVGILCKISKGYLKDSIFNFGIPLIPTSIKSVALTYTDRLFITNMASISETGVYSVGNQFALPILFLAQAFNLAYVPWLFNKLKKNIFEDKIKIVRLTYMYFIIIIIIAISWSIIIVPIIKYTSGKEFYGAISYVLWLSLGYAFTGMHMMMVNYIYYYKRIKLYSVLTISIIFINAILNYIFIDKYGAIGAAKATMLSNFISFLLTWMLVFKICDMPWLKFLKLNKK